jgi:hypothetical protein
MRVHILQFVSCLCVCWLAGCGYFGGAEDFTSKASLEARSGGKLKVVTPVSGKVIINGKPESDVHLFLYPPTGNQWALTAVTDKNGNYCWTTYLNCDGVEAGEYKVTMTWPKNKRGRPEDDRLEGKYADRLSTEFKLIVEANSPQKDVDYNLVSANKQ